MAVPTNRQELLQAIHSSYDRLVADLATVPEPLAFEPSLEGHAQNTSMSVHDLVAYLTGWNELVLKWQARRNAGEPVDFPETGFKWNELGLLAQKFYDDYRTLPYADLLQRFASAKEAIVELIGSYDDQQLYGEPWYEKYTMGRIIQFNTASPYANARIRLRKWKKQKGLA